MNAPLRRAGVVVLLLFALLFVNLNWVQAYRAEDYRTSDYNGRVQTSQYQRQRGSILVKNGQVAVAESKETADTLKYLRTYPLGGEYAHVVGYKPVNLAMTAVEKWEDLYLAGEDDRQLADRILAMFTNNRSAGGNVLLTLSPAAQDTALKEISNNRLGVKKGAVVAINPKTGALLAAVSIPTFDPNPLTSHDTNAALTAFRRLDGDPNKPLLNRAFSETYPPGSTFKVISSATALTNGLTPETVLTGGPDYQPPQTTLVFHNASGVNCPQQLTLKQALTVSCNTAFMRLCVEQLNADKVKSMAQAFGFESEPRFDGDDRNFMNVVPSHTGPMTGPDGRPDPPVLAQSCIGQNNVRMTALQGALVAATVANGGSQMRPYLIDRLQASDLSFTDVANPREQRRPLSPQAAADLQDMMVSVVDNGTGRNARIANMRVGGKTGTAENGEAASDHGWFIGFVMKGNEPIAAVAVLLEGAGKGGSGEATRIAGQVMRAIIAERGQK
jgi:peptidoglycan glycosyltransferase